jgi:hypothetical protein
MIKHTHVIPLIGVILLITVFGCDAPSKTSSDPQTQKASSTSSSAKVTMANYNLLKTGMKYSKVVEILGKEGSEMSSSELGGIKTIMYKWDGDGFGANMNIMVQNDKLISKAQFGLK